MKYMIMIALLMAGALNAATAKSDKLAQEARQALRRAVAYFRTNVAVGGGYVYHTSADLKERWGEGKAAPDQIWVQPPGTPTVGMAFLKAYAATSEQAYLDAAMDSAVALINGQLESGGWTQSIYFSSGKHAGKYRNGNGGSRNTSSLDDNQTQSALLFLMRLDEATEFKQAAIHEAVVYGLEALLKAQFPNGAFPQIWVKAVDAKPVLNASYPAYDWRTEGRIKNYWDLYTLNDGLAGTVSEVLIEAHRVYKEERYKAALLRLGDFLIRAQMPDPQPGWAQQYTYEMHPAWARKFEPAAVSGWESQDVIETLLRIHAFSGDKRYLEPIPRALAYLRQSLLPDGRLARFYELKTNKPLYMDAQYKLTYDEKDAPSHYGWKLPARLEQLKQEFERAKEGSAPPAKKTAALETAVQRIVGELDAEGRWLSTYNGEGLIGQPKFARGARYLSSEVFSVNVERICEYLISEQKR